MYSFDFDPKKSESNLEEHGIDFVDAQLSGKILILLKLWLDRMMSQGLWWLA
jgi:hypothetical protein